MTVTRTEWYGDAYQVTLSGDLTVNWRHARLWDITTDTTGRTVSLPDARKYRTGGGWAIVNRGSDSIDIDDNAGGALGTLAANQGALIGLVSNATQAGVWVVDVRSVGVVSNPALGTLGYVFGGDANTTLKDEDCLEWNPQLATWTVKTQSSAEHQRGASFVIGAKGYVCADTAQTNTHEEYDPDTWTTRTSLTTATRYICGCALNDGTATQGYVFEGEASGDTASNKVRIYTAPATDSWADGTARTTGGKHGSAANIGDKAHVIGGDPHGAGGFSDSPHDQLTVAGTDAWAAKTGVLHGRGFYTLTSDGSKGFVFGGATSDSTSASTIWDETNIYTQSSDSWGTGTDTPTGKVCESAVVRLSGIHYVCGGETFPGGSSTRIATTYAYDATTDAWSASVDMPEARREMQNQSQSIQA